ncbi:uncharacterized protein LOC114828292 [Galendromus occidentalis]|uniref:Uncharacterized protein LOC114828292 n=1 Tax=Galendromus occidentalis TaxID=34638 RepID=A0AAJ7SH31_9ACAR|nr:uncharacterized protein LOC114828292 [Galendromus occidentalis]
MFKQELKDIASRLPKHKLRFLSEGFLEKTFAFVVFSVCGIGMLYQVTFTIKNYLDYPSVVSSIIEKDAADFPAVTVCPESWFNLSQVCRYFPKNCSRKDVMHRYSIPKASVYAAWRYFGQPNIKKLFDCRMASQAEGCDPFDCESL